MRRERALKVVLVVVGLIFCGLVYPLTMFVRQEPALAMMLSVYVTLGIFLLLAARNPSANRSLTPWSVGGGVLEFGFSSRRALFSGPGLLKEWSCSAFCVLAFS
jgi:hypothetical protein